MGDDYGEQLEYQQRHGEQRQLEQAWACLGIAKGWLLDEICEEEAHAHLQTENDMQGLLWWAERVLEYES